MKDLVKEGSGNRTPEISVVIPAYNEGRGIERMLRKTRSTLDSIAESHEVIVVDDGSTDDTWEKVTALAEDDSRLKLLRFTRNFGKESAILAGLVHSRGQAVVVMDGDLQHPLDLLEEMVSKWRHEGAKVVHGVKEEREKTPWIREAGAEVFYGVMKRFSGYDLKNATDYKLLDRTVVDCYVRLPEHVRFFRGLVPWLGYRPVSVSFSPRERRDGESRWTPMQLVRLAVRAVCAFSSIPLQVVTILGALMFAASLVLGVETVYLKLAGRAVAGFSTVILLLLFVGSILMVSLGVIGQYIAMIYEEIKGRPPFVIEKSRNVDVQESPKT